MALKVAVVGMGGIGMTHARCYKENPLSELVAVCDLVREKADKAAEELGVRAGLSRERGGAAPNARHTLRTPPETDRADRQVLALTEQEGTHRSPRKAGLEYA